MKKKSHLFLENLYLDNICAKGPEEEFMASIFFKLLILMFIFVNYYHYIFFNTVLLFLLFIEINKVCNFSGYRLNFHVLRALVLRYGKRGKINFDDFIMCAVKLKTMIGKLPFYVFNKCFNIFLIIWLLNLANIFTM